MRIRTGYSFRSAIGQPSEVIGRLAVIGWDVAPISDRCSTFGFNRWTKLCKDVGMRPVYGVELDVVVALGEKKPVADRWTFFAKEELRPLHDLIALATANPGGVPSLLYDQALDTPGLIKIAGERVRLEELPKKLPKDFYIGLSPSTPKGLFVEASKRKDVKWLATSDNYYPCKDDKELYRVALGNFRSSTQTYPMHICSDEEWEKSVEWFTKDHERVLALINRQLALMDCKAKMKHATLLTPEKKKTLLALCQDGAKVKKINLKDKVYAARLKRELDLIELKKYEDYFYIIADLIAFAKKRMIVGPARGSSCGSLVCYLLDITTIDPIPYNLIFERFIDVTRSDLPDIDIDFSDAHRQEVFDYAEKKYGMERVARLGTVGLFRPKSALKQAGISLRIPPWKIEKALDALIDRSSGDSRALQALEDTLTTTEPGQALLKDFPEVMIAGRMEGHPNVASQHAAGIVITQEPVTEYVAVDSRTKSAMCDKKDAEDLNLLKIDALGLTQLSIFERTLTLIGEKPVSGWLEQLPVNDKAAFAVLNDGRFSGIFQFNGLALQSLTRQVKIKHIEDIIAITALARPGPLASGGSSAWVDRHNGKGKITTTHPMMDPYLTHTLGIVAYQEQVMEIVRNIGKMSWEDTSTIRKSMSKSLGDEFFEGFWQKFKKGANENGIDDTIARSIWDQVNKFGSWAFNRSHAVAYGMISYWCCWLKAHHPMEFAAATLDAENDPMRQIEMLRELHKEGISYVSVDPEFSEDRWVPAQKDGKRMLVGPLNAIKGIGPATVNEIMLARHKKQPLRPVIEKRLRDAKTDIDSLYPVRDAIASVHPDLSAINIVSEPLPIERVQPGEVRGTFMIMAVAVRIAPKDENEPVLLQRRNGRVITGQTQFLNFFVRDDSGEIYCKIDRFNYERLGRAVVERGRPGKALYAIKGTCPSDFRMVKVTNIRYLGDMETGFDNGNVASGRYGQTTAAGEQDNEEREEA